MLQILKLKCIEQLTDLKIVYTQEQDLNVKRFFNSFMLKTDNYPSLYHNGKIITNSDELCKIIEIYWTRNENHLENRTMFTFKMSSAETSNRNTESEASCRQENLNQKNEYFKKILYNYLKSELVDDENKDNHEGQEDDGTDDSGITSDEESCDESYDKFHVSITKKHTAKQI